MDPFLLKAARKQQGWSQAQVAEALGITERTVRRWEQGLVIPYPYYRQQLCVLFSKTAQDLGLPSEIDEDEDEDMEKAPILMTQLPKQDVLVEEKVQESPMLELEDAISRRKAYFGKTAQDLGLPPEMDEDEDEDEYEDLEEAPIPMTQLPKQDVLVEEKVQESPTPELEGSISRRNAYKIPSLMKILGVDSLPEHGRRRLLRIMLLLLVIVVMTSLVSLSPELSILIARKTPEVRETPTPQALADSMGTEVEPQVQNRCHGPDWQSHTDKSFGRYYTVKTNGSPFCYHVSWTMPSSITAAKSCDLHVFSYPGSTATVRYYFSTYHRNSVYVDINQTTSDWSHFSTYVDVSFIDLYVNDNQSGTVISVGPFLIDHCQPYRGN